LRGGRGISVFAGAEKREQQEEIEMDIPFSRNKNQKNKKL
jgi:hypothetical protein